jgi:site-specific DNA-methyltransferase (adenine-specific)
MTITFNNEDVMDFMRRTEAVYHAALFDPPYGLNLAEWDRDLAFQPDFWRALKGVLVEGAIVIAFSIPRLYHRMAAAAEAAGFEILSMLAWITAQGLNKCRMFGDYSIGAQAYRAALEPILIARKKAKSYSETAHQTGAGFLNVRGVGAKVKRPLYRSEGVAKTVVYSERVKKKKLYTLDKDQRRLTTNMVVVHSEDCTIERCAPDCPDWTLRRLSGRPSERYFQALFRKAEQLERAALPALYVPKANREERELGVRTPSHKRNNLIHHRLNQHPTVKPLALCYYLGKLICPPPEYHITHNPRLFVPFSGTGSEVIGAALAGWQSIDAVEIDSSYVSIAKERLSFWLGMPIQLELFYE